MPPRISPNRGTSEVIESNSHAADAINSTAAVRDVKCPFFLSVAMGKSSLQLAPSMYLCWGQCQSLADLCGSPEGHASAKEQFPHNGRFLQTSLPWATIRA